jgi:hypothetical protein
MTLYATFSEHVRPVFVRLVGEGLIGAWGAMYATRPSFHFNSAIFGSAIDALTLAGARRLLIPG